MLQSTTVKGAITGMVWAVIGVIAGSVVFASPAQPVLAQGRTIGLSNSNSASTAKFTDSSLPSGVAKALPSIVSLQRVKYAAANSSQPNGLVASGVIIDDDLVLTAGHNVVDGGQMVCSRSHVETAGADKPGQAVRAVVRSGAVKYGDGQDVALLKVNGSRSSQSLPQVKFAPSMPKKGETVYFVNYQPTADGQLRSPLSTSAALSRPAVFKGMVIGYGEHGYTIVTNLSGQVGNSSDNLLRKGGSGGAVLNAKGQLVGISVSTNSLSPDHSAGTLSESYGARLPEGNYQVTRTHAVTQSTVAALQSTLNRCD